MRSRLILVAVLVTLIVIAHVFLWQSEMPRGEKITWTVVNGISWTIILAPIVLVDRWLEAIKRKNRD